MLLSLGHVLSSLLRSFLVPLRHFGLLFSVCAMKYCIEQSNNLIGNAVPDRLKFVPRTVAVLLQQRVRSMIKVWAKFNESVSRVWS
jgi:hypothetical protein